MADSGDRQRVDGMLCGSFLRGFGGPSEVIQIAPDRTRTQAESGPRKGLRNPLPPHGREEHVEPAHDVTDQSRKLVDGLAHLYKRGCAGFVDSFEPLGNGRRCHEKVSCRLGLRPTSSGSQLENRHPLDWPLVRAPVWVDRSHTTILDTELLFQHRKLVQRALQIPRPPRSNIRAVLRDALGLDYRRVRQRVDVESRHFDDL